MSISRALRKDRDRAESDENAIHIRWMIRRDMPDVMGVELASFEYAWTEDDFLRCLRQRNCIGMVAERGDTVTGFMIYELHRTRLQLLNFAVAPAARRAGVGKLLIGKLIYKLCSHRRQKLTLAVRERNIAAQMFFRAHRFKAAKVLRNYYEDSGEDAYQMEYRPEPEEWAEFGGEPVNRVAMYEDNQG
ncbi:ribosomal protein S18-alanine N-acetyltransferase [Gemmata sp. JC717]|uniref:Ribosomal protein S18-alanine N-acetyltransferase n=1 Tax=Gemmata algarum TaxID=2975278 RepID=A0ABU5EYK5_9BACT|nr:ribosomal protein S18-alanine N-acetyltransferase [Gemmata algarum]MDY3553395.1 ribosomal protein S18-alanine N-acetyltransferase [Gemmata algarum]MDY3560392.1 ribosomal protein S18-alanine N-acetyltransferase [Gemmata algarum]